MAIVWTGAVHLETDGQVRWAFYSHTPAEAYGFPNIARGGRVGVSGPDDGSGVRASNLLGALESLAMVMALAARTLTPSYAMFDDAEPLGPPPRRGHSEF